MSILQKTLFTMETFLEKFVSIVSNMLSLRPYLNGRSKKENINRCN